MSAAISTDDLYISTPGPISSSKQNGEGASIQIQKSAPELNVGPDWRELEIAEKYAADYSEYGDWQDDYADSVCVPRRGEL